MYNQHILNTFERADARTIISGMMWYEKAHDFASALAFNNNVALNKAAQVIAAISPATNWEQNKKDAESLITAYKQRGFIGAQAVTVCTYGPNKVKALDILRGARTLDTKTGLKTFNFYLNIQYPKDKSFVTIDRHAIRVYEGKVGAGARSIKPREYEEVKQAYIELAEYLGILPNQLQAITWEQIRKESKGNG